MLAEFGALLADLPDTPCSNAPSEWMTTLPWPEDEAWWISSCDVVDFLPGLNRRFRVIPISWAIAAGNRPVARRCFTAYVDPGRAATINATLLRRSDRLGLVLAVRAGLKLGKDAEHFEERLAGSGPGVHGLFGLGRPVRIRPGQNRRLVEFS